MTYKRYEKYKDSEVQYIGEIPKGWGLIKLKYTTNSNLMYGANESAELEERTFPRYIRITDIDDDGNLRGDTFKSLEPKKAKDFLLNNNDILFARSGATVGKTYIYNSKIGPACFAGYLIKYSPNKKINPRYVYYFTKTVGYSDWINLNTIQATIQNVSGEKYKNLIFPFPNISTQNLIVQFLDKKTCEIDGLIKEKEKLIELLKEKREAIITEAVTKGLDKNVKMKDSGVEWIGEIPENWRLSKIKYISDINSCTLNENTSEDFTFKYVDIGSVNSFGELCELEEMKFEKAPSRARRIVKSGDSIISTVRTYLKAITSFGDIEDNSIVCSTGFAVLTPKKEVVSEYLSYLVRNQRFIEQIVKRSTGVSYPAITSKEIGDLEIIIPNIYEQQKISNYLKIKNDEYKVIINNIEKQVEKLKEYKKSVISEVVTGKVDVRNEV